MTEKPKSTKSKSAKKGAGFTVTFLPYRKEIRVAKGTNLLDAATSAGVRLNASCGGEGVCGKCKVRIESGEVDVKVNPRLTDSERREGIQQACLCNVESDIVAFVPRRYRAESTTVAENDGKRAGSPPDLAPELQPKFDIDPASKKIFLKCDPPAQGDNVNDLDRVLRGLRRCCKILDVEYELDIIKTLPKLARDNGWEITLLIDKPEKNESTTPVECSVKPIIQHIFGGDQSKHSYALAVDIGTTTVAAELVDLNTGRLLSRRSDYNAQIAHGADVISRMLLCEKNGGAAMLQSLVVGTINRLVDLLIEDGGINEQDIIEMTVAGNTVMTHIFLGLDVYNIRRSPYTPVVATAPKVGAIGLGLDLPQHVKVYTFPMASSYVGGDIVAGVIANGMYLRPEITLYMDIGTNGEIVIGNKDWLLTASCSAGPAFEGGGIEHGMRAMDGAIDNIIIDPKTFEPKYDTIGDIPPRGLCGSGILDLTAELLLAGILGPDGKFVTNVKCDRLRKRPIDGKMEFVVEFAAKTGLGEDITYSELDIDNQIRAKAAMYAGCITLLESVQMNIKNIERVLIAGGFGRSLKFENAITIGLLPDIPTDRIKYIGNGSLIGSRLAALNEGLMNEAEKIGKMMTNFELSEHGKFMEHYIAASFLPHTDIRQFPSVASKRQTLVGNGAK